MKTFLPIALARQKPYRKESLNKKNIYKVTKTKTSLLLSNISPEKLENKKIGITVGSRGINRYSIIIKAIVDIIKNYNASPIIIPAMGSHGGGNVDGQIEVLDKLNISEDRIKAKFLNSIETTVIGKNSLGIEVYCNSRVLDLDYVIVCNRIKEHTDFDGKIESGISKMLSVGLGAVEGAKNVHHYAMKYGYEKTIVSSAKLLIKKLPLLGAIAIIERSDGETLNIKKISSNKIINTEIEILKKTKKHTARIPFKNLDVLIIHEMGKNISGTGMDTNVIGRRGILGQSEPNYPIIKRVVVLDLTEKSQGNATGMGLADIATQNFFNKVDINKTSLNSIASMSPEQGKTPCVMKNDKQAIQAALNTIDIFNSKDIKLMYIKNTNYLKKFYISKALIRQIEQRNDLEVISELKSLKFNDKGKIKKYFDEI